MSLLLRLKDRSAFRFTLVSPALLLLSLSSTALAEQTAQTVTEKAADPCPDTAEKIIDDGDAHDHAEHDPHAHHKMPTTLERTQASYSVPEVVLVNQERTSLSLPELLDTDRPVMLNFIFTSCTAICPAMSATFSNVQTQLGSDSEKILMISVSIDPEYDTPKALAAYARRFDAGPQWQFLTGSLDDSIAVQRAFDADRGDKMNHAPLTLLRAAPGSPWIRYEGFASTADLVNECRSML